VGHSRIHLHSMLVHSVIALAVLAAASLALELAGASLGRLGPELWSFLLRASLAGVLLLSVPAIATGIADRDHAYATWHPSHRIKLVLSLVLVAVVAFELAAMLLDVELASTWLGAGVVANVVLVIALAAYGLRITLGRQALARTSYVPDMMRTPPVDILEAVAAATADSARLIDPSEEDAA
jgi:FtsH-binding integral membrane protein